MAILGAVRLICEACQCSTLIPITSHKPVGVYANGAERGVMVELVPDDDAVAAFGSAHHGPFTVTAR